jgi:type II secretory pathway predicted ATPase ExeA
MFETFYGLTNTPFSRTIPTNKLYKGNDSDEMIERLKYAAGKQLFAVVIGDSGSGKTTTLRRFCDEIQNSKYRTLYLSDSKLTPRTFYKNLLEQLGFESKYQRCEAKRQLHKEIEIMKGVKCTEI